MQQFFIDKYTLSELAATHDPECFNKRVPLLLELRKTEHATYEKLLMYPPSTLLSSCSPFSHFFYFSFLTILRYNTIISQETFLCLMKPHHYDVIQSAAAVYDEFVTDSKKFWNSLKKAIPKTAKEMGDDSSVAKVYIHYSTYIKYNQRILLLLITFTKIY